MIFLCSSHIKALKELRLWPVKASFLHLMVVAGLVAAAAAGLKVKTDS